MTKHFIVVFLLTLFSFNNIFAQKYADCIKAKEICKKGKYEFPTLNGEGRNNFEAVPTPCFMGGVGTESANAERNSAWIKFQIKESGSLKFKIKPIREEDDMDFVVYRLNGESCDGKKIVRCCASGDREYPSMCLGATGLRDGETDFREDPGCQPTSNGFLAPIKAKKDEWYVILVSNVTSEGPGFSITFSGSCVLPCEVKEEKPVESVAAKPEPTRSEPKPEVKQPEPSQPIITEAPKPTAPTEIDGRKTVVNKSLIVKNRKITLKVWDNSIEDGDVVSIYINGKKKFSNIELKTKPQEFLIDLEPGDNYITAHAENFGRKEPNTAALSVFDGKKEQKLIVSATRNQEEGIKITVE